MRALTSIVAILLGGAPALAEEPVRHAAQPSSFDLLTNRERAGDLLPGLGNAGRATDKPLAGGGLVGTTLGILDHVLDKLGIDRDDLIEGLSEVELSGAGDNWREENSGEVGLSFGITEHFSIGPSFGLRYEEENLAGPREEWSQQLKLGARYNF